MLAQLVSNLNLLDQEYAGAYEAPPPTHAPSEGGLLWEGGVRLILHLPQAIYILHCIALHSITQTKRFRKEI